MSARVSVDRTTPGQVRITLREGPGGIVDFAAFVFVVAIGLYALMPNARAEPAPLLLFLAATLGWAGLAWRASEEYVVDETTRTLVANRVGLFYPGKHLGADEVTAVRLARREPDDRDVVELLGNRGKVVLRIPRRIGTLSAVDQVGIGEMVASHLGLELKGHNFRPQGVESVET